MKTKPTLSQILGLLLITSSITMVQAAEEKRITLEKTEIIGVQELPRIVTIMSWKQTEVINLPFLESQIGAKLKPIDKEEFAREALHRRSIHPTQAGN